jgi:hypothetical protein
VIRFTIDGSEPTEASMTYVAPIDAAAPLMVKARAFRKDWEPSDTVTGFYKITGTVADPGVNPPGGTFTTPPKVTLATSTPEAQVRYTLDGSLPTPTSPLYAGSLTVTASSTLTVRAYKDDWAPSRMARAVFIVTGRVAEVAIDPPAGTYQEDFRVVLSTATPDARIHYTLDGSAPNAGSPVYRLPVLVSDSVTLRAAALKPAWDPSPVAEAVYSLTGTAAKPVFSPPSGDLAPEVGVTLTTATPRARIHYTTDGTTPTEASPVFGPPVRSRKSFILSAMAFRPGWEPSPMAVATYRVSGLVSPVTADPPAMVSARPFTVTLATTTNEAGIRYTLDGSEPTEESQEYTGPVTIDQTVVLQARAFFPGWTPSPILKAEYAITGAVAEPKFSVRPGVYASPQRLEITSATPGAQIRYTTDGTDPTPSSDLYTGPIDIGASITLYAQGFKDGWEPSPILAAGYTIIIRPGGKPAPKPATPSPAPKAAEPPAPKAAEPPAPKAAEPPAPKAAEPPAPKVVVEPPAPKAAEPRLSPQVSIVATEEEPEEPFVEIVDEEADDEEWAVDLADIHETRKKRHHDTTLIQAPAPEVPTALPPADWPTLTGPLPDFLYVTNEEWHNAGEEVITEGKYGSWLWVVLEGGVDVFRITPEGEIPILRLGEGCYPGAMASVLSQEHIRTATTRTAGRTCLGVLDMQRIATELVRLSFPFREMMQSLVHRVTQVTDRAVEFYQGKVHTPSEVRAAEVVVPQGEGKVPLVRIGKGRAYVVRRVKNEKAYLATLKEGDYFGSIPFMPLGHEPQGAMILGNADLATEKVDAKKFDAEFNRATSILRNIFLSVGRSIEVTTDVAQNYLKKKKPK